MQEKITLSQNSPWRREDIKLIGWQGVYCKKKPADVTGYLFKE